MKTWDYQKKTSNKPAPAIQVSRNGVYEHLLRADFAFVPGVTLGNWKHFSHRISNKPTLGSKANPHNMTHVPIVRGDPHQTNTSMRGKKRVKVGDGQERTNFPKRRDKSEKSTRETNSISSFHAPTLLPTQSRCFHLPSSSRLSMATLRRSLDAEFRFPDKHHTQLGKTKVWYSPPPSNYV